MSETDFGGLHVLADDSSSWPTDPVAQAEAACVGGASVVQLRAKHASDRQALAWAREIRSLTRLHGTRFVVNDRFDLAIASDADAVHLGQEDLSPALIPTDLRATLAVGLSTHDLGQARASLADAPSYVAFGPIFATQSKESPTPPRGLVLLAEVVRAVEPIPVVAIGGIGPANLSQVLDAGARGAAVISAVAAVSDPTRVVAQLASRFERCTGGPE